MTHSSRHNVPPGLPSNRIPVIDPKTGVLNPAWRSFFNDLVSAAAPIQTVSLTGSPFTYTATHPGSLLVRGGFVTSMAFTRARESVTLDVGSGAIGIAAFRANKNGVDQTGIAPLTLTKVTFDNEAFDYGSYYDTANSIWTPPAGLINIHTILNYSNNLIDQGIFQSHIYKNGALLASQWSRASNVFPQSAQISIVDEANGTDYYEVYAYAGGAGNKTIDGSVSNTFFEGFQVGGASSGLGEFIPMSESDEVIITYSSAPDVYYFSVGNPS